jgi:membrane-bound lytic murein transglycosylase B
MIMRKILSILLCSVLFLSFSCKEKPKEKATTTESAAQTASSAQMEKVMAIHDEVMPKMSTIGKLVGELKPKVDSTEMGQQYEVAMKDLQDAHKTMMDWMKGFGDRFNHEEILEGKALSEEKQQWLDEEEEKVNVVKEKINGSIGRAEALLAKDSVQ